MSILSSNAPAIPSKTEAARELASAHRAVDNGITLIYRLIAPDREDEPSEPIKLLELNQNSVATGIMPVYFPAHPATAVFYPSIIVEIHPCEWSAIEAGRLPLPNKWRLGEQL